MADERVPTLYPAAPPHRRHARKLSVSLPEELVAFVEHRAAEASVPFSTALAEIVRREQEVEEQARLEAALALDADENVRFARATAPIARQRLESLKW